LPKGYCWRNFHHMPWQNHRNTLFAWKKTRVRWTFLMIRLK
jgi:hypothetical protein